MKRSSFLLPALAVALLLGACGGGDGDSVNRTTTSPKEVPLFAGLNDPEDPAVAVLAFLPQKAKIVTGAKLTWTIAGPEPHTVTFLAPGQPTPASRTAAATQATGTPGPFDGSTTVSSGSQPTGAEPYRFSLTFTKTGTFNYLCAIHPNMTGSVEVVDGAAESLNDLRTRAKSERDSYLAEGRAAKKTYLETPAKSTKNANGSTTYTVLMGTSTAHTSVFAFQPIKAEIKAGDRVLFLNDDTGNPHTASFAGTKSLPTSSDSPEAKNPTGRSPQTLNATDYFNTGWLPPNAPPGKGPPASARTFIFNVPTAGTYAYVCLLHAPSGMAGQIVAT